MELTKVTALASIRIFDCLLCHLLALASIKKLMKWSEATSNCISCVLKRKKITWSIQLMIMTNCGQRCLWDFKRQVVSLIKIYTSFPSDFHSFSLLPLHFLVSAVLASEQKLLRHWITEYSKSATSDCIHFSSTSGTSLKSLGIINGDARESWATQARLRMKGNIWSIALKFT